MRRAACALAALVLVTGSAAAERISGHARVIDGDTLDIDGRHVRLEGIDAPESGQKCTDAGGNLWDCAGAAHQIGVTLTQGRTVTCMSEREDRFGRALGTCQVDGLEGSLNEVLVRAGLALAFRRYSPAYIEVEEEARAARAGMWAGTFEAPWEWRKARR